MRRQPRAAKPLASEPTKKGVAQGGAACAAVGFPGECDALVWRRCVARPKTGSVYGAGVVQFATGTSPTRKPLQLGQIATRSAPHSRPFCGLCIAMLSVGFSFSSGLIASAGWQRPPAHRQPAREACALLTGVSLRPPEALRHNQTPAPLCAHAQVNACVRGGELANGLVGRGVALELLWRCTNHSSCSSASRASSA